MESDFLTESGGIDYLVTDPGSQIIDGMFKPLEFVDGFVSTLAVRSRYLRESGAGRLRRRPCACGQIRQRGHGKPGQGKYSSLLPVQVFLNQMFHMFQLEALNNWEHISQDLYSRDLKV